MRTHTPAELSAIVKLYVEGLKYSRWREREIARCASRGEQPDESSVFHTYSAGLHRAQANIIIMLKKLGRADVDLAALQDAVDQHPDVIAASA